MRLSFILGRLKMRNPRVFPGHGHTVPVFLRFDYSANANARVIQVSFVRAVLSRINIFNVARGL